MILYMHFCGWLLHFFAEHWSHEKPGWPSSHHCMNLPPCFLAKSGVGLSQKIGDWRLGFFYNWKPHTSGPFKTKPDFRRCHSMFCLGNMQVGHGLKFKSAELGRTYPKFMLFRKCEAPFFPWHIHCPLVRSQFFDGWIPHKSFMF